MGELLNRMIRKIGQYRKVGAEPEVFIAGRSTVIELDTEADHLTARFVAETRGRKHREVNGVPVITSRTARPECLELIVRRGDGPVAVERLR